MNLMGMLKCIVRSQVNSKMNEMKKKKIQIKQSTQQLKFVQTYTPKMIQNDNGIRPVLGIIFFLCSATQTT